MARRSCSGIRPSEDWPGLTLACGDREARALVLRCLALSFWRFCEGICDMKLSALVVGATLTSAFPVFASDVSLPVGAAVAANGPLQENRSDLVSPQRGSLMEDSKPRKLISDELLEQRVAAAKALVAPYEPPVAMSAAPSATFGSSLPSRMPAGRVNVSSTFGPRRHPIHGDDRMHKGIDFAGVAGTPIYATGDGVVEQAQWYGSYGLFVQVDHGGQLETRYAHMSRIAVAPGQRVHRGDVLGYIGSTGGSTGPHLHYEVRRKGQAVNPLPYLASQASRPRTFDVAGVRARKATVRR